MDTPSPELRRTHLTRLTTPKSVACRKIFNSPVFLANKTVPDFSELSMSPLQLLDSPLQASIMTPGTSSSESPGRKSARQIQKQMSTPSSEMPQGTPHSSTNNQGFLIANNVFSAVKAKRRLIEEEPVSQFNKESFTALSCKKERMFQESAPKKQKITPKKPSPVVKYRKTKRHSFGQINSGVSHRIRKPEKRIKPSLSISLSDLKKARAESVLRNPLDPLNKTLPSTKETIPTATIETVAADTSANEKLMICESDKPLPPSVPLKSQLPPMVKQEKKGIVISPKVITRNWNQRYRKDTRERKFFKSRGNEEDKSNRVVTVSVNDNLKLQIHESPVQAKRKSPRKSPRKQNVSKIDVANSATVESSVGILSQDWEEEDSVDLSSNIQDILKGLTDEDATEENNSQQETVTVEGKENLSGNKLFPLFYQRNQGSKPETGERTERKVSLKSQWTRALNEGENQMILDAGQKAYGAVQCPDCMMVYHLKDPGDELLHARIHESVQDALKYLVWKKERVIRRFSPASYIISVQHGDSASWWKKVETVLEKVVDQELGFSETGIRSPETTKVYLYITEKKIVGMLVVQSLSKGFRMLPSTPESSGKCCSTDPSPALCGVSRIWTHGSFRRRKIATQLLDAMRTDFLYGKIVEVSEIAFSDPTENGLSFAQSYTKRKDFLVYNM